MARIHLASFQIDATVPLGHSLCGGWIKPALRIDGPLTCRGVVLLGEEAPAVLAAVDWTGICNEAHVRFRSVLAKACHTTPERVAIHCVHQHNAPFIDPWANAEVKKQGDLPPIHDPLWFADTMENAAAAARSALATTQPATHLSFGQAKVEKVASNRRLLGPDGKIRAWRASKCTDPKLRDEPEGLIDPWLKTLAFWNEDKKIATLHWYATHPMSYYGDGFVNSDFVGLARDAMQKEDRLPRLYFTGCSGNIAAGKYNDGAPENRAVLAERMRTAMAASEKEMKREPLTKLAWRSEPVLLPPRSDLAADELRKTLADPKATASVRIRAAMKLAYAERTKAAVPIEITALRLNDSVRLLHLPGECFIEHQLFAQSQQPKEFVAVAAYGDGGPWYVPTAKAYEEGGYEPSASFVDPAADETLRQAIAKVMA